MAYTVVAQIGDDEQIVHDDNGVYGGYTPSSQWFHPFNSFGADLSTYTEVYDWSQPGANAADSKAAVDGWYAAHGNGHQDSSVATPDGKVWYRVDA